MNDRVLAVRQDNHGDVLLTGPALRGLNAAGKHVTMVASPGGIAAARLLPEVAETIAMEAEWIAADPQAVERKAVERRIDQIAATCAAEAFIFTSYHQSPLPMALVLRMAGLARIHAISVDYPGSLLDTRVRVDDSLHEVERNLALVEAAGYAAPADRRMRLRPLPRVAHLSLPSSYVVVHPGATVPSRAWSPEKNRALVRALSDEGYAVVVTGSAEEASLCAFVKGESAARDLSGATGFGEFCAVVEGARAIVSGNTAAAHVAAAVHTPAVTIFPPTIPASRFRPWLVPHVLLGDQSIACAGCRSRRCPVPGQPCIGTLEPADVLAALRALRVLPVAAAA